MEVRVGDEALPLGGTRARQRAVLGCLLVQAGETVSTDRLIDALWGDRPPATAKTVIQGHVLHLRRLLDPARPKGDQGGVLRTHASGYQLVVADGALDSAQFEQLLARGREALAAGRQDRAAGLLREALSLWRGPAFGDLAYETWARAEAERLDELRLACLEERFAADLARGLDAELVGEVEALVAEHPLRERFRAQLMLALYRSGRQADALAAFREARRTLVDELGLEPGLELQELNRQVLAHDPGLDREAAGPATNLVLPPTPLTGRATELEELGQLMLDGDGRLVTLTGPGGVGKTRLALELASGVLASFEDGVWFIDLAPTVDPALVESAIATTLAAAGPLADHIGERRVLLVLDNFEQVVEGAAVVADLLAACPRLEILATSRERLRLRAETEYAVDPLPERDAVELFRARAAAVRRDLDAADDDVAELCRRLDGLPLAIELAAARTQASWSPRSSLERLCEQRLALLTRRRRATLPERHRALEATIGWSYDLLASEDEQRLFARLAIFSGSFDLEGAEGVCDADISTLETLVTQSLVRRWPSGRFGMLETIHEYARARLDASADAEVVRRAHATWYSELASGAEVRGPDHAAWLERLRAEHANFREALRWLHERGYAAEELRLASDLGEYCYHSGALAEGRRWLDRALLGSADCEDELRALGLAFAALTAAFEGDLETASPRAEEALALSTRCSPAVRGEALRALALVRSLQGEISEASRLDADALELARTHGLETLRADIANNLGYESLLSGDLAHARALLRESVASARRRGDAIVLSIALSNLAIAELSADRIDDATRHWGEALEIARRHSLGPASTAGLVGAAALMAREHEYRDSARVYGAIEELGRRAGEPLQGLERELCERSLREARVELGDDEVVAAVASGRAADPDDVIDEALVWLSVRVATESH